VRIGNCEIHRAQYVSASASVSVHGRERARVHRSPCVRTHAVCTHVHTYVRLYTYARTHRRMFVRPETIDRPALASGSQIKHSFLGARCLHRKLFWHLAYSFSLLFLYARAYPPSMDRWRDGEERGNIERQGGRGLSSRSTKRRGRTLASRRRSPGHLLPPPLAAPLSRRERSRLRLGAIIQMTISVARAYARSFLPRGDAQREIYATP